MTRPRILIIENSIAVTGALESILRSSLYLSGLFDFVFLLPKKSKATQTVMDYGFKVVEFPLYELRKSLASILLYLPMLLANAIQLKKLIREEKIDFITCNDFYNLLPAANRFFFGTTKYVCYVRFLPDRFPKILVTLWYRAHAIFAEKLIAVSHAVKNQLPENKKVIVIYNELPVREAVYEPSVAKTILYPANYIQGKGQEYALAAFSEIYKSYPDWKLRFVGGDMGLEKNRAFKNKLQELSKSYGLEACVEWNDFSDNLKYEYLTSGIVVNFSDSESFSMTCLEGMYYGRPVIATRCGGPEEIIDQEQTGLLVPIQDVAAMKTALASLIANFELRKKLGYNAYLSVREKFSYKNTIDRLQSVYLEHISKKSAS